MSTTEDAQPSKVISISRDGWRRGAERQLAALGVSFEDLRYRARVVPRDLTTDELRWWVTFGDTLDAIGPAKYVVSPPISEPPDLARIEFAYNTDLYGAQRNVASSVAVGWTSEESWLVYGGSAVPCTWEDLCAQFGECLRDAVWLTPLATPEPDEITDAMVEMFDNHHTVALVEEGRAGLSGWPRQAAAIRAGLAAVRDLMTHGAASEAYDEGLVRGMAAKEPGENVRVTSGEWTWKRDGQTVTTRSIRRTRTRDWLVTGPDAGGAE